MIELHIKNLYTKVDKKKATQEELNTLSKLLSVKVPGHYFSKAYRMGHWDGLKKFFNKLTGQFYTGLIGYVKEHLSNIEFSEIDERVKPLHQTNELSLNGIEFRPYQISAVREAIKIGRGIVAAPPNSGKTEVAAGIIQSLGLPANFLTHRLNLLFQTKERFEKRLGIEVGLIGKGKFLLKDVNILSVASLHRQLDEHIIQNLLKNTPIIIVDECHHTSSATFEKCLKESGAYWRIGLSATPLLRDDISNMMVRGLTGDAITVVTNEQLIEWGISASPSVYLFEIAQPKFLPHTPYIKVYDESIVGNPYRNGLIIMSAKKFVDAGKSVFIMVFRIKHGQILNEMLNDQGVASEFISGEGSTAERNLQMLKLFSDKKLPCIVSTSISDEGLDIPAMDVLIIGVGDRSALKVVQRVGRGLRKKLSGSNVVTIIDFMDINNPFLKKHSLSRLATYDQMGMKLYEVRDSDWNKIVALK
jgi:superfamily II DNA or RNA helicase